MAKKDIAPNQTEIEARAVALEAKGVTCCSQCRLPSGIPDISMTRVGGKMVGGKMVCRTCLNKK